MSSGNAIQFAAGFDLRPLMQGAKRMQGIVYNAAAGVGSRVKSFITSPLAGIGAAISGFFTYEAFRSGIQGVLEAGGEMYRLHRVTGMAVGSLAMLKGIATETETPFETIAGAIPKMERALVNAGTSGGPVLKTMRLLRLDTGELLRMKPELAFKQIGEAIAALPSPMSRTAAAMSIFGRAGAELLPVFDEIGEVDFGKLSEKAQLLEKNAETFHAVTVQFRRAQMNMKNMFLGIASELAPVLMYISKALSSKNALNFGKTLGDLLKTAAEFWIGVWKDPGTLLEGFSNYLMAGVMGAMNLFSASMLAGSSIFVDGLKIGWDIIKSIGQLLGASALQFTGQLLEGMGKVGSYLFAGLQYAFQKGIEVLMQGLHPFFAALEKFGKTKVGKKMGLDGFKADSTNYKAKSFQDILAGAQGSSAFVRWGQGMKEAGNKMSDAAGEGFKKIPSALSKLGSNAAALFNKTIDDDFLGASEYLHKGDKAVLALQSAGKKVVAGFAPKEIAKPLDKWAKFRGFSTFGEPSLTTSGLSSHGLIDPLKFGMAKAYGQSPLLSRSEMRSFSDAAVARGETREATAPGAFHAIHSGDTARRKAYEKEQMRQKLGLDKTNTLLEQVNEKLDQGLLQ